MTESASKSKPCDSEHKRVWVTLLNGLLAGVLVTGCRGLGDDGSWLDYFDAVDSLHVADSTLTQLLSARDSAPDGLWRVPGLGSNAWLVSPAAGRRAAEDLMGLPPDVWEVPYWPSWARILGAKVEGIVFGAEFHLCRSHLRRCWLVERFDLSSPSVVEASPSPRAR